MTDATGSTSVWRPRLGARPAGGGVAYSLDGEGPFPDPASRFQPQGVHGPSEVIDPSPFVWSDAVSFGGPAAAILRGR